jgi:hypothetical protein
MLDPGVEYLPDDVELAGVFGCRLAQLGERGDVPQRDQDLANDFVVVDDQAPVDLEVGRRFSGASRR